MVKILNSVQIKQVEEATIIEQKISSHALMERASLAFSDIFLDLVPNKEVSILILCGTGNNGGDGLGIARILDGYGYSGISVLIVKSRGNEKLELDIPSGSPDFITNLQLLKHTPVSIYEWEGGDFPDIDGEILIDAILGIGLNRPLTGELLRLVEYINTLEKDVIAVDIPTGMLSDGQLKESNIILKADEVITFHAAKLSFFFPESARGMDRFIIANIDLDEEFIAGLPSEYRLTDFLDISRIYKKRASFSHKGTYGHALIIAGDTQTIGAALLCVESCVFSGAGLTTAYIPKESELALNIRVPEAMFMDENKISFPLDYFTGFAVGPGLEERDSLILMLIDNADKPIIVDAGALNFLSRFPSLLKRLAENSILTPHMKEFDRLFGSSDTWWDRLQLAREKAIQYKIIIVLKNQFTFIVLPDGQVHINPTGNPAMASGGMGDALTGIIVSFVAQGYAPEEAAILGCYVHGKAGDDLFEAGMDVIPASKLIERIPFVIGAIHSYY